MDRRTLIGAIALLACLACPWLSERNWAWADSDDLADRGTSAGSGLRHTVVSGDSLWGISKQYKCSVDALRERNHLSGTHIEPGQQLVVPENCATKPSAGIRTPTILAPARVPSAGIAGIDGYVSHRVTSGESLYTIAKHYDCAVSDLQIRNDLEGNRIIAGQTLKVFPGAGKSGRVILGQSLGLPQRGHLKSATMLPHDRAYFRRRLERVFGNNQVVFHVRRIAREVRRRFPKIHRLAIGDISAKRGGKITMHRSHQSGRDIDIGFYFKRKPKGYPESFVVATSKNIHFKANWLMLVNLFEARNQDGGPERVFMSYKTQRIFHKAAKKAGIDSSLLRKIFQFPGGKGSASGFVRHEPGHDEHIHVRFSCPGKDRGCR